MTGGRQAIMNNVRQAATGDYSECSGMSSVEGSPAEEKSTIPTPAKENKFKKYLTPKNILVGLLAVGVLVMIIKKKGK
jgi:hypothetical protein